MRQKLASIVMLALMMVTTTITMVIGVPVASAATIATSINILSDGGATGEDWAASDTSATGPTGDSQHQSGDDVALVAGSAGYLDVNSDGQPNPPERNGYLRTGDALWARVQVEFDDPGTFPVENAVITVSLPSSQMSWDASTFPATGAGGTCVSVSTQTVGNQTVFSCTLASIAGPQTLTFDLKANAKPTAVDQTPVTPVLSVSSDESATSTTNGDTVLISASPRLEVRKSTSSHSVTQRNGVVGWQTRYIIQIFTDEADPLGTALPELPLTLTDHFDQFPNSELVSCSAYYISLSLSCTQPGGPGADVVMQYNTLFPDFARVNSGRTLLAYTGVNLFTPMSDVSAAGGTTTASVPQTNSIEHDGTGSTFDPDVPQFGGGTLSNFGAGTEPAGDNVAIRNFNLPTDRGSFYKSSYASRTFDGSVFRDYVTWANTGGIPQTNLAVCDKFDNTQTQLNPSSAPSLLSSGTYIGNGSIFYGVSAAWGLGVGSLTPEATFAIHQTPCDGGSITWFASLGDVPGGIEAVNAVKAEMSVPIGPGESMRLHVDMIALDNLDGAWTLDAASMQYDERTTPLVSTCRSIDTGAGTCPEPSPGSSNQGGYSRVKWHSDPTAYVRKSRVGASIRSAGSTIDYTVTAHTTMHYQFGSSSAPYGNAAGYPNGLTVRGVVVTDVLPAGQQLVVGSASVSPAQVLADTPTAGQTTVIWELGDLAVNSSYPISYQASVSPLLPSGTTLRNDVAIDDAGSFDSTAWRTASATVQINNAAVAAISKTAVSRVVEPGSPASYNLDYANLSTTPIEWMDAVDLLPYDGDDNGSDLSGTLPLTGVVVNNGEQVWVSATPAATLDGLDGTVDGILDPGRATPDLGGPDPWYEAPGGVNWPCTWADSQAGAAGCPATTAVTALRFVGLDPNTSAIGGSDSFLPANSGTRTITLTFATTNTARGDKFFNGWTSRFQSLEFAVETANPVLVYVFSGSIGDLVFLDANANGILDGAESGIAGVSVQLLDGAGNPATYDNGDPIPVETTSVSGRYLFTNLAPADYHVAIVASDFASGGPLFELLPSAGAAADPNVNLNEESDHDGLVSGSHLVNGIRSGLLTLSAGAEPVGDDVAGLDTTNFDDDTNLTVDFAVFKEPSITGVVFVDANNDGNQATTDLGLAGVTIVLSGTDDLGAPVSVATQTSADGSYAFANLRPGTYSVTETQPAGHLDGIDVVGSAGGNAATNDVASTIVLAAGEQATGYLFGEILASSINGSVYVDADMDSSRDTGEAGIAGVVIALSGTDDLGVAVNQTTNTSSTGAYGFTDLRPGTYAVIETQPVSHGDSAESAGSPAGDTSTNDVISAIALPTNTDGQGYDFGEILLSSISGRVYVDTDKNGVRDPGEPGVGGVTIELSGVNDVGSLFESAQTALDGSYSFSGLRPGTYGVTEVQPLAYGDGAESVGSGGGTLPSNDVIGGVALGQGQSLVDYEFGEGLSGLSGVVYVDQNNDGVRDAGEAGIGSVSLALTGTNDLGSPISLLTQTSGDGSYVFADLAPGTYILSQTQPASFLDGIDTVGSLGGDGSLDDVVTSIDVSTYTPGTSYNFGELNPASLSGFVFVDDDASGDPAISEERISGVTVTLVGVDDLGQNINIQTQTDASGAYEFTGLRPGQYSIAETQPVGFFDDGDTIGSVGGDGTVNDETAQINLWSGAAGNNYNFAERRGSLSGSVFVDTDNDGVKDPSDSGVAGVAVTLTGITDAGAAVNVTVQTQPSGSYVFVDLAPGVYAVSEAQPSLLLDGIDSVGTGGGDDALSDVIGAITLGAMGSAVDVVGYNFGELLPSLLSGSVFADVDGDGSQGVEEPSIDGVTVNLTGIDDRGQSVNSSVQTLADGTYEFPNLRPGTYVLSEIQPAGFGDGIDTIGSAGGESVVNDVLSAIVVGAGIDGIGYNFGEGRSSLSGLVFHDRNNDGIQDQDETPIAGVEVLLSGVDSLGDVVELRAVTGVDGTYRFADLLGGTYSLVQTQPGAYLDGIDSVGTLGGLTLANDEFASIVVPDGEDGTGYNFGEVGSVVSGVIWMDLNADGVLDESETDRFAGVNIDLVDVNGLMVATTTTDEFGQYTFSDIVAGDYTLIQTQPDAHNSTTSNSIVIVVPTGGLSGQNFGETTSSIGDYVWFDSNGDGLQSDDEPAVAGIIVNLYAVGDLVSDGLSDVSGPPMATTETDGSGQYLFADLVAGNYVVEFVLPDGKTFTVSEGDSSADSGTGRHLTSLATGEHDVGIDAGLIPSTVDLRISKTASVAKAPTGATVVYELKVDNLGSTPVIGGLVVVDDLPDGLNFVSASGAGWSCEAAEQRVTCTSSATLDVAASAPLILVTTTIRSGTGSIANVATVQPASPLVSDEVSIANNTATASIGRKTNARTTTTLAYTGSATGAMAAFACVLIIFGFGLVGGSRRRRHS